MLGRVIEENVSEGEEQVPDSQSVGSDENEISDDGAEEHTSEISEGEEPGTESVRNCEIERDEHTTDTEICEISEVMTELLISF